MARNEIDINKAIVTIKIFGIGGGGNNVLRRLAKSNQFDCQLVAINTDSRQLQATAADGVDCLQIGAHITNGLGTGGKVEKGQQAALDAEEQIRNAIHGADMIFITAAMGGGAGTGAAPVVARIAREMGVLSIGVVTEPFSFEGSRKMRTAKAGIEEMKAQMDALLVVKNDNLMKMQKLDLKRAFEAADETLRQSIHCIVEIIQTTGIINVDFADAVTIFRQGDSSEAVLGTGEAATALDAVKAAINNPMIDKDIAGARGIIVNITSNVGITIVDAGEAAQFLHDTSDEEEVNLIWGIVEDPEMEGRVRATVVATDFADATIMRPTPVFENIAYRNKKVQPVQPIATPTPATQQTTQQQAPAEQVVKPSFDIDLPEFMRHKF